MRKALAKIEAWHADNAHYRFVTIENTTGVWCVRLGEFFQASQTSTGVHTESSCLKDAIKQACAKARKAGWEGF